jgi:hypothetical protein
LLLAACKKAGVARVQGCKVPMIFVAYVVIIY